MSDRRSLRGVLLAVAVVAAAASFVLALATYGVRPGEKSLWQKRMERLGR